MAFRIGNSTATAFAERFLTGSGADVPMLANLHKSSGYMQQVASLGFGTVQISHDGKPTKKSIRILPVTENSWTGISEQLAQQSFKLYFRVKDVVEANQVAEQMLDSGQFFCMPDTPFFHNCRRGLVLADGVNLTISEIEGSEPRQIFRSQLTQHSWARPLPSSEGQYQLEIGVANPECAAQLYLGLVTSHGLQLCERDALLKGHELQSRQGRGDWAYHTFYEWAAKLSDNERNALETIGGPDYSAIHVYLRKSSPGNSHADQIVQNVDRAIEAGVIDRDITTYRATRFRHDSGFYKDAAYTFSTLDRDVASWWNDQMLRGTGVIEQIEIPAGTKAAYLDAEGLFEYRGFQELLLARNTSFSVLANSTTPILRVVP